MDSPQPKILLVEDDMFLRKAAEAALKKAGFSVMTAVDGEDALAKIAAGPPSLVLLDLIMPRLDGFGVLQELHAGEATKQIPVLVLSNLGQQSDIDRCTALGAKGHFVKSNLSLTDMVAKVRAVLEAPPA